MTTPTAQQANKNPLTIMSDRLNIDPDEMKKIIMQTVMPQKGANVTDEQFIAFLTVANTYGLDPLKKEIFAFPNKGAIQPIVSIDGWLLIINSQKNYDGMILQDNFDQQGVIHSVTCTMYRKDQNHPTVITEYFQECQMNTEPWKKKPIRMLRHKATIQCARYAFGLSGIMDEDDGAALIANNEKEINPNQPTSEIKRPEKIIDQSNQDDQEEVAVIDESKSTLTFAEYEQAIYQETDLIQLHRIAADIRDNTNFNRELHSELAKKYKERRTELERLEANTEGEPGE